MYKNRQERTWGKKRIGNRRDAENAEGGNYIFIILCSYLESFIPFTPL